MAQTRTLASILAVLTLGSLCMAGEVRSYVAGNFSIAIDGASTGFTKSVDGGAIVAEVINEPAGPDGTVRKHIGKPKFQDLKIQMGFSLAKPMADWIAASLSTNPLRKTVTVTELDYKLQPKSARQFDQALISSITIPAMDGASKEPAYLGISITPELIKNAAPSAPKSDSYGDKVVFLPSNFRLEIEGLDCSRVNKIDSFEIKREIVGESVGDARDLAKNPGRIVFPNLRIEMAETGAQGFLQWHQQMVVQGQTIEKAGSLILLAPGVGKEMARIKFVNTGIFSIQPAKAEANAEQIKRIVAELYVESMTIEFAGAAAGSADATTPPATPTPDAPAPPAAPATAVRPTLPRLPAGDRLLR